MLSQMDLAILLAFVQSGSALIESYYICSVLNGQLAYDTFHNPVAPDASSERVRLLSLSSYNHMRSPIPNHTGGIGKRHFPLNR